MSLPKNFWEEFDRRLDEKLDEKLKPIYDRLTSLEKKVDNIETRVVNIEGWIKRQDKAVEKELTEACYSHLQIIKQGYLICKPVRFPKKIERNGIEITEFDGIVIVTNDKQFYRYLLGDKNIKVNDLDPTAKSYIVIVEAKQYLNNKKVNKKIAQREKIIDLLVAFKDSTITDSALESCQFQRFDNNIGIYMGAVDYDNKTKEKIEKYVADNYTNELCGLIELTGGRFGVKDVSNDFGKQTWQGGKHKNISNK